MTTWNIPGTASVGQSGHTSDHNLITTALTQVTELLPSWYNVLFYGADPTGVSDSTTAIGNAITAAQATSGTVYIPSGTYAISSGWVVPSNIVIIGDGNVGSTVSNHYSGTVLSLKSSFSGSYVFSCTDTAGHGTANGALIRDLVILGANYTGGNAIDGIRFTGPAMGTLRNINIVQMSGWAINTVLDLSANEIGAFGQDWNTLSLDSCGSVSGGGANLIFTEDSTFQNIYSIGHNGPGFQITATDNAKFVNCRAEECTTGFHITNTGGVTWTFATGWTQFIGCSTDRNFNDGVLIDATWTPSSGIGTGPCGLIFTNLVTRRDGAANNGASGSYAGVQINGTNLPMIFTGFGQMTGVGDGGTGNVSPRYGFNVSSIGTTPLQLTGGMAWGYSTAVNGSWSVGTQTGVTTATGANYNYTA